MLARRDGVNDHLRWQQEAACRGDDASVFYPPPAFEPKDHRLIREAIAKEICATCPVSTSCLDHALRTAEPHGIWGGMNETERRGVLAARRAPLPAASAPAPAPSPLTR